MPGRIGGPTAGDGRPLNGVPQELPEDTPWRWARHAERANLRLDVSSVAGSSVAFVRQTAAEHTAGAVRAELARRRISGRQLARDLGWKHSTVSRRLNGESRWQVDELVAVASYLDIPVTDLLPEPERAA